MKLDIGFKKPPDYARFFLGNFQKIVYFDDYWSPTSAVGQTVEAIDT